jgi:hypothetical protein
MASAAPPASAVPRLSHSLGTVLASLADPAATASDHFGLSVAVSGKIAVVGSYGANTNAGAAYIYAEGASGWPTTPIATFRDPATTGGIHFGWSVAVSGKTAVVGAPGTNRSTGAAYIYVKGTHGWPTTPTTTLEDPAATAEDFFGYSVALSGTTAVVSSPDYPGSDASGAAYIYVKGASAWPTTPTATLLDPGARYGDYFGWSVAVSGKTAVVGAYGTELATDYGGAAYVYVEGASGWPTAPTVTLKDPPAVESDGFGTSVAVSGKITVVGADGADTDAGAAYIYAEGTSGWRTTPTASFNDPAAVADDAFGAAVAVSGKVVVVGAPNTGGYDGAAYLYVKGTSGWSGTPTASLKEPAGNSEDFGSSVAVSGTAAIVGAPGIYAGAYEGSGYIFTA